MSRSDRTAAYLLIALGAVIRAGAFLSGRSLWLDEAMLAVNILDRSFSGLLRPLDLEQVAPPLFLFLERFATQLAGPGEVTLRLVPFLASVALLPVFWRLARALLPAWWAVLALALAVFSPLLLEYSAELKQYALDGLMSAGLILLALRVIREPESAAPRRALLATGVVAVWLSTPAVFVLAAAWAGVAFQLVRLKARQHRGWLAAAPALWGAAFLVPYLLVYRAASSNPYLVKFWAGSFPDPFVPGFPAQASNAVSGIVEGSLFGPGLSLPAGVLIAALLIVLTGWARLWRVHGTAVGILLAGLPVLFGVAALTRFYPPAPRLLLALVPVLILGFAAGLEGITSRIPAARLRVAVAAALGLLSIVPAAAGATRAWFADTELAPFRPAVERLRAEIRPDDVVYLYARVLPVWAYYTVDWSRPERTRLHSILSVAYRLGPNSGNRPSRGAAVDREGDDYVLEGPFGTELFGIPTGIEYPAPPNGRATPDPGWAENEVRRIRERCATRVWLLFSHGSDAAEAAILPLIEGNGFVEESRSRVRAVRLYRFSCPGPASSTS